MKILYIMHIEWGWIKQRPHFIAEELDKKHQVRVLTEFSYRNKNKTSNPTSVKHSILWNLPLRKKFKILGRLDILLNKKLIALLCFFHKYDFIWVSHPSHLFYIDQIGLPIIYDCMDDHTGFHVDADEIKNLRTIEDCMFSLAAHTIFSSSRLQEINKSRVRKSTVIRNGISPSIVVYENDVILNDQSNSPESMIYFGTVSSWFDFEVVKRIVENCPNLIVKIIGPIEIEDLYEHERIIFLGPMDHRTLMEYSKSADYFIMPFILNELILNVDPVKIYEYVALGKPIVSIYYQGLDNFIPFVNFYRNFGDLDQICEKINCGELDAAPFQERVQFLSKSTWAARCDDINIILDKEKSVKNE